MSLTPSLGSNHGNQGRLTPNPIFAGTYRRRKAGGDNYDDLTFHPRAPPPDHSPPGQQKDTPGHQTQPHPQDPNPSQDPDPPKNPPEPPTATTTSSTTTIVIHTTSSSSTSSSSSTTSGLTTLPSRLASRISVVSSTLNSPIAYSSESLFLSSSTYSTTEASSTPTSSNNGASPVSAAEKARIVNIAAITGAILGVIFLLVVFRVLYAVFRRPRRSNADRFGNDYPFSRGAPFQRVHSYSPSRAFSSGTDMASYSTPVTIATVPSIGHG